MNAGPCARRRLAVKVAQHASWVLRSAGSPWADAMLRELDHIGDDGAALRWALGCVRASYMAKLAALTHLRWRVLLRPVAAGSLLMFVAALVLQGTASGQTAPSLPAFDETACDLPGLTQDLRPRLRCGMVSVPRDYDHPDAGVFKLAVVVIKSAQQPALPDPVVYISGGPGSPITVYAAYQARPPYAPLRDLILIDQRGTGRSEPNLCPGLSRRLLDAAVAIAVDDNADAMAKHRAAYMACRDDAIRRGIDLADFGTSVTAKDFDWVRRALGIARWNVYGESYGTEVAMTLAALHPDATRSVVLDSIDPPDPAPLWSTVVRDARDAFFAYCAQNEACSTSVQDLARLYQETIKQLDQTPMIVNVPPEMQQGHEQVRITAPLFEVLIARLLYFPPAYPTLPGIIKSVHDGRTEGLATILAAEFAAAATQNSATHAAVECRDRAQFRKPPSDHANVLDHMQLYNICEGWSELGPAPVVPTGTTVPTLILAGQFDPVARPSLSRHVAELIGKTTLWVEFPSIGHNVRHFSPCGVRVVADFIDAPAQAPDTSCAARIPPIRFVAKYPAP